MARHGGDIILKPAQVLTGASIPLCGSVSAGYPAEAYNYIEDRIDLNKLIIRNRSGNRCLWVTERELLAPGIDCGDLLVIDTKMNPANDNVVCLYWIDDTFSLRWMERRRDGITLISPNPEVSNVIIGEGESIERKGVLTHRLKKFANYRKQYGGYPVDATIFLEKGIDYNLYFLGDTGYWETLFYLRVDGESMTGDGIVKGDLLVVNRLAEAHEDSILVFLVDDSFTLKRVVRHKNYIELVGSNPAFKPLRVDKNTRLEPWGVVEGTLTEYLKNYDVLHTLRPE